MTDIHTDERNSLRTTVVMQFMISIIPKVTRERETKSVSTRILYRLCSTNSYRWSPDTAPVKSKMVYASSKESIKRSFNGIGVEIQGTDYSEVSYETVLDRVSKGRA